jgi:hypothetical protein
LHFMQRVPLLLLAIVFTAPGLLGQTRLLRLGAGVLLNVPEITVLANDGGYTVGGGRPGVGFGMHYVHMAPQRWGYSAGIQVTTRQYTLRNEINLLPAARYRLTTSPRFFALAVPLAFTHRWYTGYQPGEAYNRKNFIEIQAGFAPSIIKAYAIKGRVKATGAAFGVRVSHRDDFSFGTVVGGEYFVNAGYHLRIHKSRYLGAGLGCTFAPAKHAPLTITDTLNGTPYEGRFQPKHLSYVGAFITYSLPLSH